MKDSHFPYNYWASFWTKKEMYIFHAEDLGKRMIVQFSDKRYQRSSLHRSMIKYTTSVHRSSDRSRGSRGACDPLSVHFFKIFMGFSAKIMPNYRLAPPLWLVRVPTRPGKPGKPGKMRVHLENLEISWNFEKFN